MPLDPIRLLCTVIFCSQLSFGWSQNIDAHFSGSTNEGCIPLEIEYFDMSTGNVDSISWIFESGTPSFSTEENPTVLYETEGTFKVILTVFGAGEISKDSITIEARAAMPEPKFKFETDGLAATFSNLSSFPTQWQWDFGDGQFSNLKDPIHSYDAEGTYLVSLIASNNCQSATEVDVLVLDSSHQIPSFTANDVGNPYNGSFKPGVNLGYFPPWSDKDLADIAIGRPELGIRGAGVKAIRPGLFDHFIDQFGWDARVETYEHFKNIGLEDATLIVGFPSEAHRDTNFYCPDHQSEMFANLYEPIWDNGENGTPINDDNYFAEYLYKIVNLKKDYIQFWEIWNEPGFDYTNLTGWLPPGFDGNWWENNPDPCDYKLRAPIFHYVRTLRISYEIIKAIDPDSHVTLASVGYPAFLDAVLRNTDNPEDGSISSDYPLKAGAYFDAIGIHTYPHFDGTLREWNNDIQDFDYFRHTDMAIKSIPETKESFGNVLKSYGYDGLTYPEKEWIITEINVPRKAFLDFIGSEEAQVNFLIKAYIESVRSDIKEIHVFDMAESHYYDEAVTEFQMMGFYQRLYSIFPYDQIINNGGMAYKTASDQLYRSELDVNRTQELMLPDSIDGAAFLDIEGYYTYVLWAKTSEDMSEEAMASFSFPSTLNITQLEMREWDNSYSDEMEIIGSQEIQLSGTPVFLKDLDNRIPVAPTPFFDFEIINYCVPAHVEFFDASTSNTENWLWSFPGGNPENSSEQHPVVVYEQPGIYDVTLTVSNTEGSNSITKTKFVKIVDEEPVADFQLNIYGRQISTHNFSQHATQYIWDMGDSNIFTDNNPSHGYATPGYFTVTLYAINGCDTAIHSQDIIILPEQITPRPDFYVEKQGACPGESIQFFDASSINVDSWFWVFEGGTPGISEEQNPLITYDNPGSYGVTLVSGNVSGTDTKYKGAYITIQDPPVAQFDYSTTGSQLTTTNLSADGLSYFWEFGDGSVSEEIHPTHIYQFGGSYELSLSAINYCDTSTTTQIITVQGLPFANGSFEQKDSCFALVNFVNSSLGQVDSIIWIFSEGIPGESNADSLEVLFPEAGNYQISLIAYNSIGSDTSNFSIEVLKLELPESGFDWNINGGIYQFNNNSVNGENYLWDFGDGNTSQEFEPTHTFSSSGSYDVTLISTNSCGADTLTSQIDFLSSFTTLSGQSKVQVYPNPNDGNFVLLGSGFFEKNVQLRIYNSLGKIVFSQKLDVSSGQISHNIYPPKLPAGSYQLILQSSQEQLTRKIIIF